MATTHDKIRRRLAPFLAEQRITEPEVTTTLAFANGPERLVVRVSPRGKESDRLATELNAALADLGDDVVVELAQAS
ncbi:hypothetical protein GCM10007036_35170 [Alsobacter metallidurans]|jgi:hypothetical protein|uniref:Uncharacterized protein n=1 Tax=Alsobacter metallidurans TaxID=340221 RepID=A0A917ML06_9HYPH|nr:hypothetical protein [Alsobacter metallidurans]GGH26955.1 hypothetical protein GCM10007036_35170 [Alsobacter metallidurans]